MALNNTPLSPRAQHKHSLSLSQMDLLKTWNEIGNKNRRGIVCISIWYQHPGVKSSQYKQISFDMNDPKNAERQSAEWKIKAKHKTKGKIKAKHSLNKWWVLKLMISIRSVEINEIVSEIHSGGGWMQANKNGKNFNKPQTLWKMIPFWKMQRTTTMTTTAMSYSGNECVCVALCANSF